MNKCIFTFMVVVVLATCSAWLLGNVYTADPNDRFLVDGNDSYVVKTPVYKPTHICSVHGEIGTGPFSYDMVTITIDEKELYVGCSRCIYTHLAAYLKKNVPAITKIKGESQ